LDGVVITWKGWEWFGWGIYVKDADHAAAGPPARIPRKMTDRVPPIKFIAQNDTANDSMYFHLLASCDLYPNAAS
jgi:hypothetical protein